jgi:hypothetical protein
MATSRRRVDVFEHHKSTNQHNKTHTEKLTALETLHTATNTKLDTIATNTSNIQIEADAINLNTDELETKIDTTNTKLNGGLPSALSSDQLKVIDAGSQVALGLINNNTVSIAATNASLDGKADTRDGHLNNIANNTSNLATESTLADIDTKLVLPSALSTTTGSLKVSIEESSAGGDSTLAEQQSQTALLTTIDTDTGNIASNTSLTNSLATSIDNKIPTKGQKVMTGSTPVVIASNQTAVPVSASSLPLPSGASSEATLSSIDGKITACNTGAVVVSSSALPSGASSEATLSSIDGKITACNTGAVVVSSSALPSGASSEATLSSIDGKITACDTGAVAITSSLPTGLNTIGKVNVGTFDNAITIQDGGNSITIDGTITANAGTNLNTSSLATESTLSSLNGKVTACDTGSIAGSVTANAGTNLNTSALALETGGNLATIAGDTTSLDSKITQGSAATLSTAQQILCYGLDNGGTLDALRTDASGHLEITIDDFVKGNTTASASFPVTDASKKVKDVVWMTTELISANSFSTTVLDTEGYSSCMIYGEQTAGTNVINNQLKIVGSNTSGGTYFHMGANLSAFAYVSGRNMLVENTPLLYNNHARYLKIYNDTGGSVTITLRAVLSDFHEYQ